MENSQKQSEPKDEPTFKKSLQTISKIYNSTNGFPTKPKKASFDAKSSTFYPFTNSNTQLIPPQIMQSQNNMGQRKLSSSNKQNEFSLITVIISPYLIMIL